MNKSTTFLIVFVTTGLLLLCRTDGQLMSGSLINTAETYMEDSIKDVGTEIFSPPENSNTSIKYNLYTPNNPTKCCIIEPNTEALQNCPINSSLLTKILITGFLAELRPGNLFEEMKDNLLKIGSYNVIIMDWTKYNQPPYTLAVANAFYCASRLAQLIDFLKKNAGIKPETIHLIGHSLGAQLAGAAGKRTPNLGMITGLDPAGPEFNIPISLLSLAPSDANYVQVMHTSVGLGKAEPLGDIDFFVNGGVKQPFCHYGTRVPLPSSKIVPVNSPMLKSYCNHIMALIYYVESINSTDCRFFGTMCSSYEDFMRGGCTSKPKLGDMGFHGEKIPDVPPLSKFYLKTHKNPSFCLSEGFKGSSSST